MMTKPISVMIFSLFVLLGLILLPAVLDDELLAQDSQDQEAVTVVTKDIEPFVFVDGQEVSGFSIDLWQALALELGLPYEFEIVTTVQEQLDAVEQNQADVAIAAISITAEREERLDFSHRYFESGLGILTHPGSSTPVLDTFRLALSPALLRLLLFTILTIIIAGHIIWLIERRRNEDFPKTYFRGVSEGLWWAAVTVTTVGYGDRTPIGRLGRLFGVFWMFAGLFIIANFTAGVTSQLTLQSLQGVINGPEDLRGKRIATVAGSTSEVWLESEGIGYQSVTAIDDAYELLDSGSVQAVVYDYPVLLYYALQNESKNYIVPGTAFNKEDYGMAFPHGSPLREDINRALLVLVENGTYDQIYSKWYGDTSTR